MHRTAGGNNKQKRIQQSGGKPSGLLASQFVDRAPAVLREDLFEEPTRSNGTFIVEGDYVRFFDSSDSQLSSISAAYNASPTTRAIIRQKATLVMGDGLMAMRGRSGGVLSGNRKGEAIAEGDALFDGLNSALSSVNAEGQSIAEVLEQVITEYLVYGNAFFSMSRTASGDVFAHALPMVKCRVSEVKNGIPSHVGVNQKWKERQWTDGNVQKLPLYPLWSEQDADGVQRTAIHLKDYAPGFDYYGLPEWVAALLYAEIEYRIAKFNASKFENGYMPSGLLQFFGAASEEEAQEMVNDAKKRLLGTGKNSGLLIQVLSDESYKASFVPFEQTQEGEFQNLTSISAQAIVSAHRWTMSLAGFATKGQLGSNEQIKREFEIVQNTVIRPLQNMLLSKCAQPFMKALSEKQKGFAGCYLQIQNTTPVSFIGDIDIDAVLTTDEKREVAGYSPIQTDNPNGGTTNPNPDTTA